MSVQLGYVVVYVGIYPSEPITKYAWRGEGGNGTISVKVRSTDPQFLLATYYYVTL